MGKLETLIIRKETPADIQDVEQLIEIAFQYMKHSDHSEHLLVSRLRKSKHFIPELSLVALLDDKIVGHILLTGISIGGKPASLALAPVSVLPPYQNIGIGEKLILESHKLAKKLGYSSIILVGHKNYYPRFGYKQLSNYGIQLPFDVPDEHCMAVELIPDTLSDINGTVDYPKEFFE